MTSLHRPRVTLLSQPDAARIAEDACRTLEQVGVFVENEDASRLLLDAGAAQRNGRYHIPERLVRDSLASAPDEIRLYDRDGNLTMSVGEDRVHFDPGSAAIHVLDRADGTRRDATTQDVIDLIRLVNGLPNYSAQSTALMASDVPKEVGDRYRLYLVLRHSTKPVITGTFAKDGFAPMRDMLSVFRGSDGTLADKPLAIFDCCPSPPLKWSDLTCQVLIDCARSGIPAELISMPLTGATSPVTLRDTVVQHCAENLSGVVIHQLARPGAPIIYGGAPSAIDMRHGSPPSAAMETIMIELAYAQVGKHLGLPTHGYLGVTDSKTVDYQAGMESGIGAVLAALAGINVISGPGMLDFMLTQSLEELILDHETCGMALRLVRGIARREEDPVDLIRELVATGEFLSHDHTRKYWKEELSIASPVIDRDSYGDWVAKGSLSARERAAREITRRLSLAKDPLPADDRDRALVSIMQSEASRWGADRLPG